MRVTRSSQRRRRRPLYDRLRRERHERVREEGRREIAAYLANSWRGAFLILHGHLEEAEYRHLRGSRRLRRARHVDREIDRQLDEIFEYARAANLLHRMSQCSSSIGDL